MDCVLEQLVIKKLENWFEVHLYTCNIQPTHTNKILPYLGTQNYQFRIQIIWVSGLSKNVNLTSESLRSRDSY